MTRGQRFGIAHYTQNKQQHLNHPFEALTIHYLIALVPS